MTSGTVNAAREAVLRLRVIGPGGDETEVDAVVDTGFSAALTLPEAVVAELGLWWQMDGDGILADGTPTKYPMYAATVVWNGGTRDVLAAVVGSDALIGMQLLADHELRAEVRPGGTVEVRPLPDPA